MGGSPPAGLRVCAGLGRVLAGARIGAGRLRAPDYEDAGGPSTGSEDADEGGPFGLSSAEHLAFTDASVTTRKNRSSGELFSCGEQLIFRSQTNG
jgi:hypothetical protein